MDDRLSQHGALSARELIKICHICKATRRRQTQRQFYMLLMLQPIAQLSCGFTFPTQMFLFSPLDVTQVSAKTTLFVTGTGQNHRKIKLQPIFHALGPAKAAALPAFHALRGADNTGCFSGRGKACWKAFIEAGEEVIKSLSDLG